MSSPSLLILHAYPPDRADRSTVPPGGVTVPPLCWVGTRVATSASTHAGLIPRELLSAHTESSAPSSPEVSMTRRVIPPPRPSYRQTYPDHLATADDLQHLGLRPGSIEPDAILKYDHGVRSGLCALFERARAVPWTEPARSAQDRRTAENEAGDPEVALISSL